MAQVPSRDALRRVSSLWLRAATKSQISYHFPWGRLCCHARSAPSKRNAPPAPLWALGMLVPPCSWSLSSVLTATLTLKSSKIGYHIGRLKDESSFWSCGSMTRLHSRLSTTGSDLRLSPWAIGASAFSHTLCQTSAWGISFVILECQAHCCSPQLSRLLLLTAYPRRLACKAQECIVWGFTSLGTRGHLFYWGPMSRWNLPTCASTPADWHQRKYHSCPTLSAWSPAFYGLPLSVLTS